MVWTERDVMHILLLLIILLHIIFIHMVYICIYTKKSISIHLLAFWSVFWTSNKPWDLFFFLFSRTLISGTAASNLSRFWCKRVSSQWDFWLYILLKDMNMWFHSSLVQITRQVRMSYVSAKNYRLSCYVVSNPAQIFLVWRHAL